MTSILPRPSVTVVHSLPGRVRMRLSRPPASEADLIDFVREHPGMGTISITKRTGSFLVEFDPHAITTEEITLRTAFGFAIDQGGRPVRLLAAPEQVTLQNSAVLAGIGLTTAFAMRWLSPAKKAAPGLEWLAGAGTAWSVLDHGWRELRGRGYFDPEVLALAYLAAAFLRGNVLTASAVTWAATFGRHLIEMPSTGRTGRACRIAHGTRAVTAARNRCRSGHGRTRSASFRARRLPEQRFALCHDRRWGSRHAELLGRAARRFTRPRRSPRRIQSTPGRNSRPIPIEHTETTIEYTLHFQKEL